MPDFNAEARRKLRELHPGLFADDADQQEIASLKAEIARLRGWLTHIEKLASADNPYSAVAVLLRQAMGDALDGEAVPE